MSRGQVPDSRAAGVLCWTLLLLPLASCGLEFTSRPLNVDAKDIGRPSGKYAARAASRKKLGKRVSGFPRCVHLELRCTSFASMAGYSLVQKSKKHNTAEKVSLALVRVGATVQTGESSPPTIGSSSFKPGASETMMLCRCWLVTMKTISSST